MSAIVLTCPACSTRYRATADSLGLNGRTVRCARCDETWFEPSREFVDHAEIIDSQVVDPDALAHADNEHTGNETGPLDVNLNPSSDPFVAPEIAASTPDPIIQDRVVETVTPSADQEKPIAPPAPPIGADVMMRDHADQLKLKRRRRTIAFIWLIPLIIVILAAIIAWTQRQAIVNRIPQMATLYQAIGVEVRAGGLKMDPPTASMDEADGVPVLRIQSVIHNLTDEAKAMPLIELMLHNEMGETLTQWYVETTEREIAAKGQISFSTDYPNPPEGAVGVRYRLVGDGSSV